MGLLHKLKDYIIQMDYMSNSPNLKIEGQRSYRTLIGGITNILLIVLSLIGIIYFSSQMINKTDPNVIQSSMEGHAVGPYPVSKTGFNLLMGIEFSNSTYYMNDRIYTINATVGINTFDDKKGQIYEFKTLEYDKCSTYYNKSDLNTTLNLENFWCFKPNQVEIEGYWGAKRSSTVKFYINACVNSTLNNNNCLPEAELNKYLQGGILSMFTTNSFLNLNDPKKPVETKLQNWYNSLNLDFTYDYFYNLKELTFEDDQGFLLKDSTKASYFYYDNPLILYYGRRGSLIATVNLQGNKYGSKIKRSYTKIQDVVTRIGGLLKAFSIVATFIAYCSSEFEFFGDSLHNFKYQVDHDYKTKVSKNNFEYMIKDNKITNNNFFIDEKNPRLKSYSKNNAEMSSKGNLSSEINLQTKFPIINSFINKMDISKSKISSLNLNDIEEENKNDIKIINNYNTLQTTLKYYSNWQAFTDFIAQLFGIFYCKCQFNKSLLQSKENYTRKINKLLSINYLFKKLFLLEKVINSTYNNSQLKTLHAEYIDSLMKDSKNVCYDDSDVFNN